MTGVNFLYLGADKCGSSWICNLLRAHPDVRLSRAKELFYFDRFYAKGPDWYARQFPEPGGARRVGEICHDYLYSDTALERIARDTGPDAVFLVVLRDPMERAVSHYRYMRKIGKTSLPFAAALERFPRIAGNSLYARHVEAAFDHLGQARLRILWYDDLRRDPRAFGSALCEALGIAFLPDLPFADRVLEGTQARHPGLVRVLRAAGWGLRGIGLPSVVGRVKESRRVSRLLYSRASSPTTTADLPRGEEAARLREMFARDCERLRHHPAFRGRTLPGWLDG